MRVLVLALWLVLLCMAAAVVHPRAAKEQYLVGSLPGLYKNVDYDDIPLMFSGQLELYPENNTHYYFWKYTDRNKLPQAHNKTIFWLNGGPGCLSMDGALMEAGPFRINKHGKVTYNDGSWHRAGDIVFVDQPAGTGFSYSDAFVSDLHGVLQHFLRFLDKYFELFPDERGNEVFIAGESYAGQYIPYIARGILDRNAAQEKAAESPQYVNLSAILIGNGWVAPGEQSLSYLPYLHQAGIIGPDNKLWANILRQHEICQNVVNQIEGGTLAADVNANNVVLRDCERVLTMILEATADYSGSKDQQCFNMYDYTLKDSYPSCGMNWPPDLSNVNPFLNNPLVLDMLNVKEHRQWRECTGGVGRHLKNKNFDPAVKLLPSILAEIPVMLFNGNRDIICNYMGTEDFVAKMEWNGGVGFGSSSEHNDRGQAIDWVFDSEVVGYIKTARNLTFVNVFDASHMVPFDKPHVLRSLMDLMTGQFDDRTDSDTGKPQRVTYLIGTRVPPPTALKPEEASVSELASNSGLVEASATAGDSVLSSALASASASGAASDSSTPSASSTTSRITRLIQLLVICILIWGIYVLYASYRSRPSSIIKTRPSSGKKKNVQWADQLRLFMGDEHPSAETKASFLSKAYNKLTGHGDSQGVYAPAPVNDIEMGVVDGPLVGPNDASRFALHDDDEEATQESK